MKTNSFYKFVREMFFGAGELIFANVESKIGFALMFFDYRNRFSIAS